ncbi:hypothetical protein ASPVEDRAFT_891227 [Aspergillus versicolor CBS 583.65]|uniref:Uncharacterized protein n=1 Tax=Aspergillus versicolor CBS 583.65 TaxID=1036611 RepID=A0A1L9PR35_ASPVE|nr:uncharacterized protein ASPVEDRAFT_891227 [Aspergillus versicolor CBS 583.65]OJJ03980.1 hypothetical protein ASPVEDRAFT_891227 [Aspergillus versicolor CBS 583.65]
MAVRLHFDRNGCSQQFEDQNREQIQGCVSGYRQIRNGHGHTVVITEATVMNELLWSPGFWDRAGSDHSTIRLANDALTAQNLWYTMHWRPAPDGLMESPDTVVFPWNNREAPEQKRKQKLIAQRNSAY